MSRIRRVKSVKTELVKKFVKRCLPLFSYTTTHR